MISYCDYDIIYDIILFFQYHSHLPIPCAIFSWYCLRYHIHIIWNLLWYHYLLISFMILAVIWPHIIWYGPLISLSPDIMAIWYHKFPDMLPDIMAPGRRDGAGWGRQGPGAPPPPASPSPTCWGRVCRWTETVLIPRMDLFSRCNVKFQVLVGKFQVGRNFNLKFELMTSSPLPAHIQSSSPSWSLSSCRPAALSSGLSHWQSCRSALESARPTRIHCQSGSAVWVLCDWQMAVVYKCSEPELVTSLHEL